MAWQTIPADDVYESAPDLKAAVTLADGESATVETHDSLEGAIQFDSDLLEEVPPEMNGATGPIAVEGARPGDVLAVGLNEIRVAEDRGRALPIPDFVLLRDDPDVDAPRTRVMSIEDGDSGSTASRCRSSR